MKQLHTVSSGNQHFAAGLTCAIMAEQQFARILPRVISAVDSPELSRALRRALTLSNQHQQILISSFTTVEQNGVASPTDDLERQIDALVTSGQGVNDITYTDLIIQIVEYKICCYEQALALRRKENPQDQQRVLGAALSDESATALILQEVIERLLLGRSVQQTAIA